jgi:hypothetical protein
MRELGIPDTEWRMGKSKMFVKSPEILFGLVCTHSAHRQLRVLVGRHQFLKKKKPAHAGHLSHDRCRYLSTG